MNFKPLVWEKVGDGDNEQAVIKLNYPPLDQIYRVGTDGGGRIFAFCVSDNSDISRSSVKFDKRDLSSIEDAKNTAQEEYQRIMSDLFGEVFGLLLSENAKELHFSLPELKSEVKAAVNKYGAEHIDIVYGDDCIYGMYHSSTNSFSVTADYSPTIASKSDIEDFCNIIDIGYSEE